MADSSSGLRGVVSGMTVELEQEPGLPDGQEVMVRVQPVEEQGRKLPPGEGIRRSAGAWAEGAEEVDQYLEWVRQQRKVGRPELEP
jgi:hypothetical protein